MKPQFDHQLMSSLRLFVDHRITQSGQAFFNTTGQFFSVPSSRSGIYSYGCPYMGLINDASIQGATAMTGVYLNGNLIGVGVSGLQEINHYRGTLEFSTQPSPAVITGSFSVKEVNVETTTHREDFLIFESKYFPRPKYSQQFSGLPTNSYCLPIVFLKNKSSEPKPFAIGGTDLSEHVVRAIIIADSDFMLDGITSILKDAHYRRFSLVSPPFTFRGGYTGTVYNYTGLASGESSRTGPLIQKVSVSEISTNDNIKNGYRVSFADLKISQVRDH